MAKEVDRQSPLGKIVHSLLGLNCFTSEDGQLSTGDPKHIFKRKKALTCDATLLRNFSGIMVGQTNIRPDDVVKHLAALPDMTLAQARLLLDPADKQNVPKAVSLVQQLDKLRSLLLPSNPFDFQMRKTINFFSTVLGYFVLPFITVEMDLSQQVESLSTYAFLAAALEIRHGSFCLTGPLYSDSQAVVKNIIFTIARMQIINPNLKFYIILDGTDRLEGVFADVRTQDHARNFDIEQLAGKLSVSALIHAAFQRNPDLDRGHRRLSLSGALGVDHINPKSWVGNTRVGGVDIAQRWKAGEITANALLQEHFGPSGRVDFSQRFSKDGFDLLRPMGKYVGLDQKHEDKRSEEENETELFPGNPETQLDDHSVRHGLLSPEEIPSLQTALSDQDYQDMPLGMDLDQFFPDEPLDDSRKDTVPVAFSKVLEAEGKKYLKSSLVATLSSNRSKKATMRTLRVRGVALEDLQSRKSEAVDPADLDDDNLLKSGDLVATLLHTDGKICLGIVMAKGFRVGADTSIQTAVSLSDLQNPAYKARVVGQVIEMCNPRIEGDDSPPANFWEWTGNYVCLDVNAKEERETRQLFVLDIPGLFIHPLDPSVSKPAASDAANHIPTWTIPTDQLTEILETAWLSLKPLEKDIAANVAQLPQVVNPAFLPYCDALGLSSMQKIKFPVLFAASNKNSIVQEERLNNPIGSEPCGFCGLDGCFTQLLNPEHPKKPVSIKSSCCYHYAGMNYKAAKIPAKSSPSTNVPIHCALCPPNQISGEPQTIWKYNAMHHIVVEHSLANNILPSIPTEFMKELFIRKSEEDALGISAAQTADWRRQYRIPDSDAIDMLPGSDDLRDNGEEIIILLDLIFRNQTDMTQKGSKAHPSGVNLIIG
ncbi:hypothetical protein B0H14DRAFT_2590950 [Mycena olivaceomarginata]|nr:hypothetical protein B0H14DRAFT_2590950 [Mycena olivaceomarginata]